MDQKSTNYRTLLRYIYQESTADESALTVAEILKNNDVADEYKNLISTLKLLPKVQLSPERTTIHNVLHHMRISSFEAQH
ncbi:MAG: hypothetical protein IPL98_15395 [Saprospiraceae bacterium]|nr:hypothetical protein [Saprospiraceae bacterium]